MPLTYSQQICPLGTHPFHTVEWHHVDVLITNAQTGAVVFEQSQIEAPANWSQQAVDIMASKYFRGHEVDGTREHSVKDVLWRVVRQFAAWAVADKYLEIPSDGKSTGPAFAPPVWNEPSTGWLEECAKHSDGVCGWVNDLLYILLHQMASFNSPVWFNMGTPGNERPQTSACFVIGVDDNMDSILEEQRREGVIYQRGSGTGCNWSRLRARGEPLAPGGFASGPVSFIKGTDAWAGVIKSGGSTRRAAKMCTLDIDHPDIVEFIECKAREEDRAHLLINNGVSGEFNQEHNAYDSVPHQNANHSVVIPDLFMQRVEQDGDWYTSFRLTKETAEVYQARELWQRLWEATHFCGDPGVQFTDAINAMNPLKSVAPIRSSNPCGEYLGPDDTACNLASLNLVSFLSDASIDAERMGGVIRTIVIAMDLLVHRSSYPYEHMSQQVSRFRALGLGYTNLGSLLMRMGLPYDSDAGRSVAADITAYLTSTAAVVSTELAEALGPFPAYSEGTVKEDLRTVWVAHCNALGQPPHATRLRQLVAVVWEIALKQLDDYGARNAYLTLLAPTGTISFLMGADTTGCEPEFALRKTKKLVGGSSMPLPNEAMRPALEQLGYSAPEIETVLIHLKNTGDIAGTAIIRDEHLSVFDCATAPEGSKHNISSKGHLWMLAAIQPHLSMGISKTVNLPEDITVDEMADIGFQAWKLKLKGVTLYRSGCKRSEPLNVDGAKKQKSPDWPYGYRRKMPHSRRAVIQDVKFADKVKFQWMFGHRGDDRDPNKDNEQLGEIFVKVNKEGSTLQGALDGACMMASLAIQHGASVAQIIKLLSNTRWPPNGRTNDPNVKTVSSPLDYLARYLRVHYDDDGFYRGPPLKNVVDIVPVTNDDDTVEGLPLDPADELRGLSAQELYDAGLEPDGEVCWSCGNATYRQGSCQVCPSCGSTTGCGG